MNKVKILKNTGYTTISNVFLRDKRLSLKSKGLLACILALPNDWDFSIKGVCAITKEGTTAIYSAIDELKEYGYCNITTLRDDKGHIIGNDYTFLENPYMENPNMDNQAQINKEYNKVNNKKKNEIDKSISKKTDELFEKCWVNYRRKGSKKKSKEYWDKLTDEEKNSVLPHIKAYISSRELSYQKDFERYLRDKIFTTIVFNKNIVVYDPTRENETKYIPETSPLLMWNDYHNCYMYLGGFYDGNISDGYDDENRPNGATITLNNGRGTITWNSENKQWIKS